MDGIAQIVIASQIITESTREMEATLDYVEYGILGYLLIGYIAKRCLGIKNDAIAGWGVVCLWPATVPLILLVRGISAELGKSS